MVMSMSPTPKKMIERDGLGLCISRFIWQSGRVKEKVLEMGIQMGEELCGCIAM